MKGGASTWLVALSELRQQVVKKAGEAGKPRETVTATATADRQQPASIISRKRGEPWVNPAPRLRDTSQHHLEHGWVTPPLFVCLVVRTRYHRPGSLNNRFIFS